MSPNSSASIDSFRGGARLAARSVLTPALLIWLGWLAYDLAHHIALVPRRQELARTVRAAARRAGACVGVWQCGSVRHGRRPRG
jgi:hypothetical protein